MPTGQEHVQQTLDACQAIRDALGNGGGAGEDWRQALDDRLESLCATLRGMEGRFFLRSKLCLPFAARCSRQAEAVGLLATELDGDPSEAAQRRLSEALALLEKAVQTLDERSQMQGMAIT